MIFHLLINHLLFLAILLFLYIFYSISILLITSLSYHLHHLLLMLVLSHSQIIRLVMYTTNIHLRFLLSMQIRYRFRFLLLLLRRGLGLKKCYMNTILLLLQEILMFLLKLLFRLSYVMNLKFLCFLMVMMINIFLDITLNLAFHVQQYLFLLFRTLLIQYFLFYKGDFVPFINYFWNLT